MAVSEEIWLQQFAPASLWNTLIARVRSVFSGIITYDMNWSTLSPPFPTWMSNADLSMIGISEYIPLTGVRERIDPVMIYPLWRDKIKVLLDNMSITLGKQVVISEIGYRNSADALYLLYGANGEIAGVDHERGGQRQLNDHR